MSTVDQVTPSDGGSATRDRPEDAFQREVTDARRTPGRDPRPQDGDRGLDGPSVPLVDPVPPGHDDAGQTGPTPRPSIGVPAGSAPGPVPLDPTQAPVGGPAPLGAAVEAALATGEPLAVQRLVTVEGRDPFAIAQLLDGTVERLWDEAGADPAALARAEAAGFAADAVRVGRGPVTFAIALDYTLRDVGVLAPGARIGSVDEARALVVGAPESQDRAVREALARAQVGSGVLAEEYGVGRPPPPPPPVVAPSRPPAPPLSMPEEVPQDRLTREVAEALATGDPLVVQRLVTREGRDAFAVAHLLEDAVEQLWDAAADTPEGLERAERAEQAVDGVRMGRGPVTFALALAYTLREAGALGADEALPTLEEARDRVETAPDSMIFAVRDAVDRAQGASGLVADDDFGIVLDVPDPGLGIVDDLVALSEPGAITFGWQLPKWSPVSGGVLVVVPNGEGGLNEPGDFTETDGDARNTIMLSLRIEGAAGRDFGRMLPGAGRFRTLVITFEPEGTRLVPFLNGEAPLFGENGLVPSFQIGSGYSQPSLVPDLPGGIGRAISGPSLVGNIRGGSVSEDDQRVYTVAFAASAGVDTIVAMAGLGVAGVSAVVPGGQGVAAGAAHVAGRAQAAGEVARRTAGVPVAGAAWSLEVRFDTAAHPNGPGFDGVYYKGERIGLLSDGVRAAIEAEAQARGITVEDLLESGAEDAIMRGLGGMTP